MKIIAIMYYIHNKEQSELFFVAHKDYRQGFLEDGRLRAAGPFADDSGAIWTLEVETIEEAAKIVNSDPYVLAGVCTSWKLYPLNTVLVSPIKVPTLK